MADKDKIRQILGCDSCTDRVKCKYTLQKHNKYYCDAFDILEGVMKWKDEQYRMDKAHLDMVYEALDRLYHVRYGDEPILDTGSQTDVFLHMIEEIINETKPQIK